MLDHLAVGELAHLVADGFERVVEAAGADRGVMAGAHQLDQARAVLRGVAGGDQRVDLGRHARGNRGGGQAEIGRAHDLALADRNAAEDLREIFAEPDADEQFLDLARAGRSSCMRSA